MLATEKSHWRKSESKMHKLKISIHFGYFNRKNNEYASCEFWMNNIARYYVQHVPNIYHIQHMSSYQALDWISWVSELCWVIHKNLLSLIQPKRRKYDVEDWLLFSFFELNSSWTEFLLTSLFGNRIESVWHTLISFRFNSRIIIHFVR